MPNRTRIGIVGCGGIAGAHLEGYHLLRAKGCEHFEITALCDAVPALTQKFAETLAGTQASAPQQFTTLDDLISSGLVDGVDVCTPHSDHHQTAIRCLEAGIHVMVEKPMGVTVRAARKMIDTAGRTGRILSVAENSRRGLGQRAMTWLFNTSKWIGEPRLFAIENMTGPKFPLQPPEPLQPVEQVNWRMDKLQAGGGWTYDGGVHLMDSLRVYFGRIESVYAEQKAFSPVCTLLADGRKIDSQREDACIATFRFASGLIGSWTWSFSLPGVDFTRVAFYGDRGYVLDQTAGGWTHTFGGGFIPSNATLYLPDGTTMHSRDLELEYLLSLNPQEQERLFPHGVLRSVAQECHEFIDCIREGRPPEVGPQEGLEGLAISAAIYESALASRAVRIEEVKTSQLDAFQREVDQYWGLI